jgi:hypothetical protein
MARKRKRTCSSWRCSELPVTGGLCQAHHNEEVERQKRENRALALLHGTVRDGQHLTDPALREELFRLQAWWSRICSAVISQRGTTLVPLDEAEAASSWCKSLAWELSAADAALRQGEEPSHMLAATRDAVWERFGNLEKGLMSNGQLRAQS